MDMIIQYALIVLMGFLASIMAAVPFGLVNLSVLKTALKQGKRPAYLIAHGAAVVEVLFVVTAIFAGKALFESINGNSVLKYVSILILSIAGLVFMFKKRGDKTRNRDGHASFFKGILLNLLSFQVFFFWVIAITFMASNDLIRFDPVSMAVLVVTVWTGKMIVLWLYVVLSRRIVANSSFLSTHTDTIIGIILILIAAIQLLRL